MLPRHGLSGIDGFDRRGTPTPGGAVSGETTGGETAQYTGRVRQYDHVTGRERAEGIGSTMSGARAELGGA